MINLFVEIFLTLHIHFVDIFRNLQVNLMLHVSRFQVGLKIIGLRYE